MKHAPRESAFTLSFRDNHDDDLAAVLERLEAASGVVHEAVAVGVTTPPARLFAVDLSAGTIRWTIDASPTTTPIIAGGVVVAEEDDRFVGRELSSGRVRFSIDSDGFELIGAAGEDDLVALTLSKAPMPSQRSRLLLVRGSLVEQTFVLDHAIGVPAVIGSLVFIPWGSQNLSVLDGATDREIARLRVSDTMVSQVFAQRGKLFYGHHAVFRFGAPDAEGARFTPPTIENLPGSPAFLRDAYEGPIPPESARHHVRLDWHATDHDGVVGLTDHLLFATYFRAIFAFADDGSAVRWARLVDDDVVGEAAVPGGLWVADQRGRFQVLDARNGAAIRAFEVPLTPEVVVFRVDDPDALAEATADAGAPAADGEGLLTLATATDARLAPARALAIQRLTASTSEEATRGLVALCQREDLLEVLRTAACNALSERSGNVGVLLEALGAHASFLEGRPAPPAGALAVAAASAGDRRAVPLLVEQLTDPETPSDALGPIATALGKLGDASAAAPLEAWLRLYHADNTSAGLEEGLVRAAEALCMLEGEDAGDALRAVAADPFSVRSVRERAAVLATNLDEEDPGIRCGTAPLPEQLDPTTTHHVIAAVEETLRECVANDRSRAATVRLMLVVTNEGAVESATVVPVRLARCMEPALRTLHFPPTQEERQEIQYDLQAP